MRGGLHPRELSAPQVLDVYQHKSNLHLVLEYLDSDLEQVIQNKVAVPYLSPADIKSWMLMALRGLYHCHCNWVLHRVRGRSASHCQPHARGQRRSRAHVSAWRASAAAATGH